MVQAMHGYSGTELIDDDERERLILEHLPQVRLIARRIQERLPDQPNLGNDPSCRPGNALCLGAPVDCNCGNKSSPALIVIVDEQFWADLWKNVSAY